MESYGPPQVRALTRASRAFCRHPQTVARPLITPRGALFIARAEQQALH